jgi:hypothetical protein
MPATVSGSGASECDNVCEVVSCRVVQNLNVK